MYGRWDNEGYGLGLNRLRMWEASKHCVKGQVALWCSGSQEKTNSTGAAI